MRGTEDICLSLDVDWAPESVLSEVLGLLTDHGVRATLFCTHPSKVLRNADRSFVELALHPRYDQFADPATPLDELLEAYPRARGARSHSLAMSSPILQAYAQRGLVYESNHFLPLHPGLRPVVRLRNLISIPFYWSDDHLLAMRRPFDLAELALDRPGLKVLNFHPIHIYANTSSQEHYARFKPNYQDAEALAAQRDPVAPGIGVLFRELLERLRGRTTQTLAEVHDAFIR